MHKSIIFSVFLSIFSLLRASAQDASPKTTFTAEADQAEVLLGNYITVSFTLEGGKGGQFVAPDWESAGFEVRGGPSQSSNFSMINGVTKSTMSYTYYVEPRDTGTLSIPIATIRNGKEELHTQALSIHVSPNPDGLIEQPQAQEPTMDFWGNPRPVPQTKPAEEPKKKRKTTRI